MTKTLKQLLEEEFAKADYEYKIGKGLIDSNDIIINAVKEWLTQKQQKIKPLQKGATFTEGKNKMIECGKQLMLKELLEEIRQNPQTPIQTKKHPKGDNPTMTKTLKQIKSIAMLKMEKNFIAVIQKGYKRQPYNELTLDFLLKRLNQEIIELNQARQYAQIREELADCSNIIDYIYEKILQDELLEEINQP